MKNSIDKLNYRKIKFKIKINEKTKFIIKSNN